MSGYPYPGAGSNGNNQQPFNQYNFQQYSPQLQGYPQLATSQHGGFPGSLQHNTQNVMPYGDVHGLQQHQTSNDPNAAYQDFTDVYSAHNPSFTPPRQAYSPPQLVSHGQHAGYQQLLPGAFPQRQQQTQAPPPPQKQQQQLQQQQQQHHQMPLPVPIPVPVPLPAKQVPGPAKSVEAKVENGIRSPRKESSPITPVIKKARTSTKRGAHFSKKTEEWDGENGSEEDDYNMDGLKTKSGRKVHKPSQFNPSTKTASKKRGAPGKKIILDSLFCKVCDRGHSPRSNLIVFCDGCNDPYHQLCHTPVIDNLLITLPDAEWFCSSCDVKREQKKLEMGHNGADLSEEQKKTYLISLPTSHLVQLILHASSQHPDLGLFSPTAAAQLESTRVKQEAARAAELAKMVPFVYQPVPGDEILAANPVDQIMAERIMTAVTELKRPALNRDIIEYIESHHLVNPMDFRVKCAEQIGRLVSKGLLDKEGPLMTLPKGPKESVAGSAAVQPSAGDKASVRVTGGVTTSTNAASVPGSVPSEEQYPPVVGIKLPQQSEESDGFLMNEMESPAFSHVVHTREEGPREEGVVDAIMTSEEQPLEKTSQG